MCRWCQTSGTSLLLTNVASGGELQPPRQAQLQGLRADGQLRPSHVAGGESFRRTRSPTTPQQGAGTRDRPLSSRRFERGAAAPPHKYRSRLIPPAQVPSFMHGEVSCGNGIGQQTQHLQAYWYPSHDCEEIGPFAAWQPRVFEVRRWSGLAAGWTGGLCIVMTNGGPASGQTFFGSPCSGKTLIDQQPPHRTRIASCESDYWRIEKSCQHLLLSGFARLVALSKLPACDLTDFVSLSLTSRSKTKTIVIACKLRGLLQGTRTRPSTRHHCLPWPIRRKHTCLNFPPSSRTESMPKVFPS